MRDVSGNLHCMQLAKMAARGAAYETPGRPVLSLLGCCR